MKGSTKVKIGVGLVAVAACVGATIAIDSVASYYNTVITRWWSGTFTKPVSVDGDTKLKAQDNAADLTETVAEEGIVLLKNKNNVLPMAPTGDKRNIVLLGGASYAPTYVGVGSVAQSSDVISNDFVDFYDGFETAGYKVDKTMKNYYEVYGSDAGKATGSMNGQGWTSANDISDIPLDDSANGQRYRQALDSAKAAVNNGKATAVVVFSRVGSEGGDCKMNMTQGGNIQAEDVGKHYLEFMKSELDLIQYAKNNFERTIVVINSSNPMELGPIDTLDVDACLWIAGPGSTGIQALADIIAGDVNPSGHLVDTWAYDMTTAPAYWGAVSGSYSNYADFESTTKTYNGHEYQFNNKVDGGVTYDCEGIYVGYRWYETADAEGFWSSQFAADNWNVHNYNEAVQFPFGFGLSYTNFDWSIESFEMGGVHEKITAKVKVTNVGNVAGKDVVQLYYTAPYTKNGIEKSAKVLGAFAKTKMLKKGESDVVTLQMDVDELASYDYKTEKAYVADAGEYQFNFQTDAHNIKRNVTNNSVLETQKRTIEKRVYDDKNEVGHVGKRSSDKIAATNAFDLSSQGDGYMGSTIPWTSRSDFAATHPIVTLGGKRVDQINTLTMSGAALQHILNSYGGSDIDMATVDANYVCESLIEVKPGTDSGLKVDDLAGYKVWDDEIWDRLVNQMSVEDLALLIEDCGYGTPAIASIGKGLATDVDGPAGISSANLNYYGNEYCTEPLMAATWNVDLLEKIGASVAREARVAGVNGWYAPGCDLHRHPFNGRTGEYFSEDGLLSGKMAAAEVKGAQDNGLYVYLKHFALNDNDQNRGGMYTWANEQEIRELQLKAWEYPTKESDLSGVMEAYNRIGPVECSVNYGLNTTVLKKEWGFKGLGLTDGYSSAIGCDKYEHPDLQVRAGCGMLLYTGGFNGQGGLTENTTNTEAGVKMLHDAAKRLIYRHCNSNAMTSTRDYTPYWIWPVAGINVLLIAGAICAGIFLVVRPILKERKGSKEGE